MQALRQARALASADGAPLFRFGQRFLAEGTYDVPAGHATSDLTSAACHIGLNRRRDLTLRGDLSLMVDGKQTKIVDLFKARCSAIVGLPDLGSVCRTKHTPEFVKQAAELKAVGCSPVYLISVATQEAMDDFAKECGVDGDLVKMVGDTEGSFTRMLGVDLDAPASQRYAGIVQDGILIRMCVEQSPGEVEKSTADRIMQLVKCIKQ